MLFKHSLKQLFNCVFTCVIRYVIGNIKNPNIKVRTVVLVGGLNWRRTRASQELLATSLCWNSGQVGKPVPDLAPNATLSDIVRGVRILDRFNEDVS